MEIKRIYSDDGRFKAIAKKVEAKFGTFATIGYDDQQNLCIYQDETLIFSCNKLSKELDYNCVNEFLKVETFDYKIIIVNHKGNFYQKEIKTTSKVENYGEFFNKESESVKLEKGWNGDIEIGLVVENDIMRLKIWKDI